MLNKRKLSDRWIIGMKPYSNLDGDNHLAIVLCYIPGNSITPYATWVYNKDDKGFHWGHYYTRINEAIPDFLVRGHGTAVYNSEMIKTYDAIECHYCTYLKEGDLEQCEAEDAQLISVYLHCPSGGIEWITDHLDGKDAMRIVRWISNTYELPIQYQPKEIHYVKLKEILNENQ